MGKVASGYQWFDFECIVYVFQISKAPYKCLVQFYF